MVDSHPMIYEGIDMQNSKIKEKARQGIRFNDSEILDLYENADLNTLSELSTLAKKCLHREDEASYLIMAIINYTNICVAKCDYCSFYRLPHQSGTYLLSLEQIYEKIDAVLGFGGTMVGFNGGFHPKLRIHDYADIFASVRQKYGNRIQFYGMTVAEFMFASRVSKMSYDEAAKVLAENGSEWVTGGGAEIMDNDFRMRHSPGKYKVEDYYNAQRSILNAGMGSTATMVIGFDETTEERMNHLRGLRDFQDSLPEDRKLTSFLCWTYKPYNNELGGKEISSEEYWRWLAVCRLYLDNFTHIRTSVLTKNKEALKGLQYGANDFDLPTEDEVTQKAGAEISHDFAEILDAANDLGFKTILREPFPTPGKEKRTQIKSSGSLESHLNI
jgi:cyclic dehypoxanthinyl futalosine synthase